MIYLLLSFLIILAYLYVLKKWKIQDEQKQIEFANRKPPPPPETELSRQYQQLLQEVQKMKKDAEILNTTETFAKYSKLQRQLIPKEEQLEQLKNQYEQEQQTYYKQMEEEQAKISKPISEANKIKKIQLIIIFSLSLIFWFIYFDIDGVNIEQLQPIISKLGYRSTNTGVQIWGINWLICCHLIGINFLDKFIN